mgnify:CR=1 FL=1
MATATNTKVSAQVIDGTGKSTGTRDLPAAVFGATINEVLADSELVVVATAPSPAITKENSPIWARLAPTLARWPDSQITASGAAGCGWGRPGRPPRKERRNRRGRSGQGTRCGRPPQGEESARDHHNPQALHLR